jgi:hypothetical protein
MAVCWRLRSEASVSWGRQQVERRVWRNLLLELHFDLQKQSLTGGQFDAALLALCGWMFEPHMVNAGCKRDRMSEWRCRNFFTVDDDVRPR